MPYNIFSILILNSFLDNIGEETSNLDLKANILSQTGRLLTDKFQEGLYNLKYIDIWCLMEYNFAILGKVEFGKRFLYWSDLGY